MRIICRDIFWPPLSPHICKVGDVSPQLLWWRRTFSDALPFPVRRRSSSFNQSSARHQLTRGDYLCARANASYSVFVYSAAFADSNCAYRRRMTRFIIIIIIISFMGWVSSQLLLPNSLLSVNLYSLLLKTSSDGASTTYCGNRFQQFTTFWLKKHILHCFSVLFCTVCSYILKALQYLYQLWWRINNLRQLVTNICYSHWQLVPVSM